MTRRHARLQWAGILTLAVAALAAGPAAGPKDVTATQDPASLPARLWRDPGRVASLDVIHGASGKAGAPDLKGTFTFAGEDPEDTSPKFEVVDDRGITWKVKLGEESQAEVAATRFLWAAGYFADEDHYVAELKVKNLPILRRGQEFVSPGGIVHGARLERKLTTVKKIGNWDWFDNPFVGQRELNGLRVMMSFLNNWDLKQVNNAIYVVNGERHYLVSDAGATFGNTGNALTRSKSVPKDYEESQFIDKITPDFVDFILHSRPFFLGAFKPANYQERTKMEAITKHIPRADAKWLGHRLAMLTDHQIRDVFRAAGYDRTDVEILTHTIRLRIAALEAL